METVGCGGKALPVSWGREEEAPVRDSLSLSSNAQVSFPATKTAHVLRVLEVSCARYRIKRLYISCRYNEDGY
jgi:hypothetical protein